LSNHFSAANLKSPGNDPRLDFTDLFAFRAPHDPGKTVLIMDANPFRGDTLFHPEAVYRVNADLDGDAQAEVAFSFTFSEPADGRQAAAAWYATGSDAREAGKPGELLADDIPVGLDATAGPVQAGEVNLFAGVRSDPFFADIEGALHGFQWTGQDSFAGKNVLSLALEVPAEMISPDPLVGLWATVSLRKNGEYVQMDRGGHPTINPFINPDDVKDDYNAGQPADDVQNYLEPWSQLLMDKGGYSAADAKAAVRMVLPDILRYDRTKPARYPNGRSLTDDVYSERFAWLSNGRVPPDGLTPHGDLTSGLPYLGAPNPQP
jgi:hypothetical protein